MKLLRQFGLVIFFCLGGELFKNIFHLPLPGNIVGMILLFLALNFKLLKAESLSEITSFLLDHLAFFFIPAGVGILGSLDLLKSSWLPLLIINFISTFIVMIFSGHCVQLVQGRKK